MDRVNPESKRTTKINFWVGFEPKTSEREFYRSATVARTSIVGRLKRLSCQPGDTETRC